MVNVTIVKNKIHSLIHIEVTENQIQLFLANVEVNLPISMVQSFHVKMNICKIILQVKGASDLVVHCCFNFIWKSLKRSNIGLEGSFYKKKIQAKKNPKESRKKSKMWQTRLDCFQLQKSF